MLLAVSYTVSVVKDNRVQDGDATNRVQREISILWLAMPLFGKSICYLSVGLYVWKMILPHLKSSIPAEFCKLNHRWSLVQKKLCILG